MKVAMEQINVKNNIRKIIKVKINKNNNKYSQD